MISPSEGDGGCCLPACSTDAARDFEHPLGRLICCGHMDPDAVLLAARLTPPVKELIDQVETKWSGFLSAVCLDWITAIKQEEIQVSR